MTIDKGQQVRESLKEKKYREALFSLVLRNLALQIRQMRKKKGWTQAQLGARVGRSLSTISHMESANPRYFSMLVLKRMATVFDVALLVRFTRFSELVDWLVKVTPTNLTPPSYDEEHD